MVRQKDSINEHVSNMRYRHKAVDVETMARSSSVYRRGQK